MFRDVMGRADITSLGEYILNGGESLRDEEDKSFKERLKSADKEVRRFAESRFSSSLADEVCNKVYELAGEYSSVHFEIGMLVGAKTVLQLEKKLKELS